MNEWEISLLSGGERYVFRRIGCEHCLRGVDAVEIEGPRTSQRVTGSVAEALWSAMREVSAGKFQ